MPPIRAQALERIRRDHDYMIELVRRIKASCTQGNTIDNCNRCESNQRQVCHGDINDLIRTFVEATQKHHLYESVLMSDGVPQPHQIAHKQAHWDLAKQMKAIRLVFSADGDCVVAIAGIETIERMLLSHREEYDRQLEEFLLQPV